MAAVQGGCFAFVDVDVTALTSVATVTRTAIKSICVAASSVIANVWRHFTLIDIAFTGCSVKMLATVAREPVNVVNARSAILTGIRVALVIVITTCGTIKTWWTKALEVDRRC